MGEFSNKLMKRFANKNGRAVSKAVKPNRIKGAKNGLCNITACQKPGATWFNKCTKKYYCGDCAREINWPGGRADTRALYGTDFLCEQET